MAKALALVSGGLDSILAARLIKDQDIEVTGLCFKSAFFGPENAIKMAGIIGIPLKVIDFTDEHINMTRAPKHGYGKNMNPCIDCHALMLKLAGRLMANMGADFLVTGEVLNQRPMSQTMSSLDIVKKESEFGDRILRPLCAKNLPPTQMELDGMVDREKLLDIKGRSRKTQMELAHMFGITEYPSPAGGCKLTEPGFARRLKDLYQYNIQFNIHDIEILKIGRHFRLSPYAKAISMRNAIELNMVKPLIKSDDIVFDALEYSGSTVILRGASGEREIALAAAIAARYSKGNGLDSVRIVYGNMGEKKQTLSVKPAKDEDMQLFML